MERWQKIAIAVLAALVVAVASFGGGYSLAQRDDSLDIRTTGSGGNGLGIIREAYETIRSTAVDPPSERQLARAAVKGMVKALQAADDPFALFYSPQGYRSFQELTTGRFSGIGVWLKDKEGRLEIISVLPASPALSAGLERGDVIRSIDGTEVDDLTTDEAVTRIKGPEGTDVVLGIERAGILLDFTISRREIALPNLTGRSIGDDLGYVRLFGFARGAGNQVRDEVEKLTSEGVDGVVLDLRDNGGGLFAEAIDVASVFIEDGEIVTYQERASDGISYDAEGDAFEDLPLVVLVNEGSASASEIVAGALQDRGRAILVGATTYGKGSVQEVVPLLDSSALKLTTGSYLTPNGAHINGDGIEPDIEVDAEPQTQKERAVEILRGILISTRPNPRG